MSTFMKTSLLMACASMLTSCSMLSPVSTGVTNTYVVNEVPTVSIKSSHRHSTVLVTLPESDALYNTTDMAYTTQPYQISYFAKNNWAESPAQLIQPLIVQTLQNTHAFHAVNTNQTVGHVDYVLNTQLLQFEQDFTVPRSVFRLALRAQLIQVGTNQIVATKLITVNQPTLTNTPYGGVIAANHATAAALRQLAVFCGQHH